MPYDPDLYPGGAATVTNDGTELYVTGVSINDEAVTKPSTTTGDYATATRKTYRRSKVTASQLKGTLEFFIDNNANTPVDFSSGTELTNLVLNMSPGHAYTMPEALITNVKIKLALEDIQSFTCDFESQGEYTTT